MGASVMVTLDTEPPGLGVTATRVVAVPDPWEVRVTSSEPIGTAAAALRDSQTVLTALGVEYVDESTLRVLVPTVGVPGGPAGLMLRVTDTVGNAAVLEVPVDVDRVDWYSVEFTLFPAYEVAVQMSGAFQIEMESAHSFDVMVETTSGFEVDFEVTPAYDVSLEVA